MKASQLKRTEIWTTLFPISACASVIKYKLHGQRSDILQSCKGEYEISSQDASCKVIVLGNNTYKSSANYLWSGFNFRAGWPTIHLENNLVNDILSAATSERKIVSCLHAKL
jgi:hypothetical protein